jgi:hypothetical protein
MPVVDAGRIIGVISAARSLQTLERLAPYESVSDLRAGLSNLVVGRYSGLDT